jgi:steroid 5-alpha reductase family enzyme
VDFIWSNFPIFQAAMIYSRSPSGDKDRQIATLCIICVWGFRLTHNFYARGGIGHEDWRYTDMREQFGKHFWWISLFSVFLGQTIFLFAPSLSIYGAMGSEDPMGAADWMGLAVCVIAVLLETVADTQVRGRAGERVLPPNRPELARSLEECAAASCCCCC